MHPLIDDLSEFSTMDLEKRLNDLTKKYFSTPHAHMKTQILNIMNIYREELSVRQQRELTKLLNSKNKEFDNLVQVQ